jgi:hypothetical protein
MDRAQKYAVCPSFGEVGSMSGLAPESGHGSTIYENS